MVGRMTSRPTALDPDAQAVVDAVQPLLMPRPLHVQGVARTRALAAALPAPPLPVMDATDLRTLPCAHGPVQARIDRPGADAPLPTLVWMHGGAYCIGDAETGLGPVLAIAREIGCAVVSVDYRLAPEHRFPAAFEDAWGAVRWVAAHGREHGLDGARIAVGGESAGAGIAAAVAIHARDAGAPRLAAQVLVCPGTAYASDDRVSSRAFQGEGPMLSSEDVGWAQDLYLRDARDRLDPRAVPASAPSLRGVAPAVVVTADHDPLLHDGRAYAARLVADDVAVTYRPYTGVFHGFFGMGDAIAKAQHARAVIAAALRVAFSSPPPTSEGQQ